MYVTKLVEGQQVFLWMITSPQNDINRYKIILTKYVFHNYACLPVPTIYIYFI